MGMLSQRKNHSKSATRALDILDFLANADSPRRASDIAEAFDLARSSANPLLKSMVDGGYLLIDPDSMGYWPSFRAVRMGHRLSDARRSMDRLCGIVEEVHACSGEAVTLTVQNDCAMQIMAFKGGEGVTPEVGTKLPVLGSTIGSAVLTTKTSAAISRLIRRSRRQYVIANEEDWGASFLQQIRLFRMKGFSWRKIDSSSPDRLRPPYDMWTLAMHLPEGDGIRNAVLGMAGPIWRVRPREQEMVNLMCRAIRNNIRS